MQNSSLFTELSETVREGVFVASMENNVFSIDYMNPVLCKWFSFDEFSKQPVSEVLQGKECRWLTAALKDVCVKGEYCERTVRTVALRGGKKHVKLCLRPVYDGEVLDNIIGTVQEIMSQVPLAEAQSGQKRDLCALALEYAPYGVAFVDDMGIPTMVNHTLSDWIDTCHKTLKSHSLSALVHPEDRAVFSQMLRKLSQGRRSYNAVELRLMAQDGIKWVSVSLSRLLEGDANGQTIVQFVDISKRKENEDKLLRLATQDHLTGLANRMVFEDSLKRVMKNARRYRRHGAVIYIDLNDFKGVNDTYGHKAGDAILKRVGEVLNTLFRDTDIVARIGGDEFAVIMDQVQVNEAHWKAKLVEQELSKIQVQAHGKGVTIGGASTGVQLFDHTTVLSSDDIVEEADKAMYQNKTALKSGVAVSRSLDS